MEYLQRVHSGSDWAPKTKMQMQERTALFTPMGTAPKSAAHVTLRHLIHLLQYPHFLATPRKVIGKLFHHLELLCTCHKMHSPALLEVELQRKAIWILKLFAWALVSFELLVTQRQTKGQQDQVIFGSCKFRSFNDSWRGSLCPTASTTWNLVPAPALAVEK